MVGSAAWHGRLKLLEKVLKQVSKGQIQYPAMEEHDPSTKVPGPFKREMHGYTPLMLAIAKGDENLECAKLLLREGADFSRKDEYGNTVLHIAALNGNNKVLDYLSKNLKINLFERNQKGETALNICHVNKNPEGVKILEQYQDEYDKSRDQAQELMDELAKEQEQDEDAKNKRR